MKRLLFIVLTLLTVHSFAQVKVIGGIEPINLADTYKTHTDIYGKGGYRPVATIAERNAISFDRRSAYMLVYVANDSTYMLQSDLTTWKGVKYGDVTKAYVDSIAATRLKLSDTTRIVMGVNPTASTPITDARSLLKSGFYSLNYNNLGLPTGINVNNDYVTMLNIRHANNTNQKGFAFFNQIGSSTLYWRTYLTGSTYSDQFIWDNNNLKLGTPGQSIRVNSGGTAFEAYTPATVDLTGENLQVVATRGASYSGRLSTQGNDGTLYHNFTNQTSLPTPASGQVNIGTIGGSIAWKNPLGGRRLRTNFAGDIDYYLPTYNGLTVQKLPSKDSVDAQLALKMPFTDSSAFVRKSGATMSGNLNISKTLPVVRMVDQNGNYSDWQRAAVQNTTTMSAGTSAAGSLGQAVITNSATPVYGSMPDNGLPTSGAFTIGYWARLNTLNTSNTKVMYYAGDPTTANGIVINAAPGGTFRVGYGAANTLSTIASSGGVTANDLNYHHVVFTYSGAATTTGILYVDGIPRGSSTTAINIATVGAGFFGRFLSFGSTTGWNGDFDQAFYYSRDITPSEVSTIYNNNVGSFTLPTAGLIRLYQFDQTSGTTAPESVSGTYPITFNSAPVWDLAGKVSTTAAATVTQNEFFRVSDGQNNGLTSQLTVGNSNGGTNILSSIYQQTTNGYTTYNQGLDGHIYITNLTSPTPDNNKSFSPTAMLRIGSYNSSLGGQLKFDPQASTPTASAGNIGLHTWDVNGNMNVVTDQNTVKQYAYKSDATVKTLFNQGTSQTVTNTTTETTAIGGTGTGSLVLPANYLTQYKQLRINFSGVYGAQTLSAPTLTIRVYLGSVMIASGSATAFLLGATGNTFNASLDINTMSIGAGGSVYAQGLFNYNGSNNTNFNSTSLDLAFGTATVNTTISNTINITYQWGNASTANLVTTRLLTLLSLN